MLYSLIKLASKQDWEDYHLIRKAELFAGTDYDEKHPDEYLSQNHPLLLRQNGRAAATARLDFLPDSSAIIRLLAVKREKQGSGVGRELYSALERYAQDYGIKKLLVNAAPEATGYYEKLGFTKEDWDADELKGIAEGCTQMSKKIS